MTIPELHDTAAHLAVGAFGVNAPLCSRCQAIAAHEGPVHAAHFSDGYPLCWSQGQEGEFVASGIVTDVTCQRCLVYATDE